MRGLQSSREPFHRKAVRQFPSIPQLLQNGRVRILAFVGPGVQDRTRIFSWPVNSLEDRKLLAVRCEKWISLVRELRLPPRHPALGLAVALWKRPQDLLRFRGFRIQPQGLPGDRPGLIAPDLQRERLGLKHEWSGIGRQQLSR